MSDAARRFPYIWVTWLSAALAGDDHCEWKHWFKTHFQFDKRPQSDEDENRLAVWKTNHAEAVRARATMLRSAGYSVSLEDQNKFNLRGGTATVGGVADIVAYRERREEPRRAISLDGDTKLFDTLGVVRIEDLKTGRRRSSDLWQVLIYMALLPRAHEWPTTYPPISGAVVYGDGQRDVTADEGKAAQPRIFARIKELASPRAPDRTPSAQECRFCDIASCPDRVTEEQAQVMTEDF